MKTEIINIRLEKGLKKRLREELGHEESISRVIRVWIRQYLDRKEGAKKEKEKNTLQ